MAWTLDARIPLTIVTSHDGLGAALAGGGAALLAEGAAMPPPAGAVAVQPFDPAIHPAACDCGSCGGRNAAAVALDQLFQARVRGGVPWFTRVVALASGAAAQAMLRQALAEDAVTAARFRMA